MKPRLGSTQRGDTTMLDVLAIICAAGVVIGVFLLYAAKPKAIVCRVHCGNNLKQIGLCFRIWSNDNNDKYPMQVSTNLGGTMELVSSGLVFPHFAVMSNELSTPRVIICPEDVKRVWVTNFTSLTDSNISYFVVPEADETMQGMWLSGDHNLSTNNVSIRPGLFTATTNRVLGWTSQLHTNVGNICFADGSVQQHSSVKLQQSANAALQAYSETTSNTSNTFFRIAIP